MKRRVALIAAMAALSFTAHAETAKWSVSVAQGKQNFVNPAEVRISKAPFRLIFSGPSDFGFAVLASVDCTELKPLTTPELISQAIRPTNIIVEGDAAGNRFLSVNGEGAIKADDNGAHVWQENQETSTHSFQSFKVDTRKQLTGTREINEIVLSNSYKDSATFPVANYPRNSVCLLVTGLPPVGRMAHDSPKLISIHFN